MGAVFLQSSLYITPSSDIYFYAFLRNVNVAWRGVAWRVLLAARSRREGRPPYLPLQDTYRSLNDICSRLDACV